MPKTKCTIVAALFCLALVLACAPAGAQDSSQGPAGGYSGQMPPGGPGGLGPQGPGRGGRPPFGPPPALGGRFQVVSGAYTAWQGGKPEAVKALVRLDSQPGETWILQETNEGGSIYRQWVKINETR